MSKRARRLAKYLEDNLGWSVYENDKVCPRGHKTWRDDLFCGVCGGKLIDDKSLQRKVNGEIEGAIAYALGEKPWPRVDK